MTVHNGQKANETTFNNGFLSRDTDSDTTAVIGLNNVSSGGLIANAQQKINDNTTAASAAQTTADAINTVKGAVNGFASLDGTGRVPENQIPLKFMSFEGNWDASTNTPTLSNTDLNKNGFTYKVTLGGTVDFGAGNIIFQAGDWVYWNSGSSIWDKADNIDQVLTVAGRVGDIVLNADDVSETTLKYWSNKNNFVAVVSPTINDDSSLNYVNGSLWFNTATKELSICTDNSIGAAVWSLVSGGASSGGGASPDIYEYSNADNDIVGNWTNTGTGTFSITGN